MADQEFRATKDKILPTAPQGQFRNLEQFLLHSLHCSEPNCLLPLCVNTKLLFKHTQGCTDITCSVCQQMRYLASKHSESCIDYFCCIPFCMQAKLKNFAESHVDQSSGLGDASQKQKPQAVIAKASNESGCSVNSENSLLRMTPSKTPSRSYSAKSSRELASKQTTSEQKSSSSFKRLRADSFPPRALKRMPTNCGSASHSKPASLTKPPCHNLGQHSHKPLTKETTTQLDHYEKGVFMEPTTASHESSLTTAASQAMTYPPFVVQGTDAAMKVQNFKEFSSPFEFLTEHEEDTVNNQVRQNKELQESMDQLNVAAQVTRPDASQNASRAMRLSLNSSMGGDNKDRKTQSSLLKARFFHALLGLQRLIMKTKSRGELLICVGSLKSALHEIKNLDPA